MPISLTTGRSTVKPSWAPRAAMLALLLGPTWFSGPAQAYTVYVSNEKDDTISVIDSKSLQVTRTVKVGRRPRGR